MAMRQIATTFLRYATLLVLAAMLFAVPAIAEDIGVAEKVVKQAIARSANKPIGKGDGLAFNEVVANGTGSAIEIVFTDESHLILGEDAEIILDSMVYEPNQGVVKGTFRVVSGVLRFKSAQTRLDMMINTPSGTIGIRGTEFDLLTTPTATEIAMLEGVVEVSSAAGTATVSAGQSYRMSGANAGFLDQPSPAMRDASGRMMTLIAAADEQAAQIAPTTSPAASGGNGNRLIMDLASGPVVIEMRPDLAPNTVARIREMVASGAFNGLEFQFVRPGYVAETAAPPAAATAIKAELSDVPFEKGTLGLSHDRDDPDSGNGKFFIALGRAQVLDGKYTVWGKVVSGMEHLEAFSATTSGRTREKVKTLSLAQ
jgi:peptidylprolyl isomerase